MNIGRGVSNKIRRWRQLSLADRAEWGQAVVLLPLTALAVRLVGFKRCYAVLDRLAVRRGRSGLEGAEVPEQIERSLTVLRRAVKYALHGGNCLSRSLLLRWLLLRRGIECDLRIGTRMTNGQFEAHAWLEYQGQPLNEDPGVYQRYIAFDKSIKPEISSGIAEGSDSESQAPSSTASVSR